MIQRDSNRIRVDAAPWLRFAAALILAAAVLPGILGGGRRNWAYLRLLHGAALDAAVPASGVTRADDFLVFRRSVDRGDWITTERMLAVHASPDRLAPLIVVHEAERRADAGDFAGARAALSTVLAQPDSDSRLLYRVGEAYERAHAPREAVQAYERGAAGDPAAPWTEGRYRIAMIYQREEEWASLANVLAPLLGIASDEDIGRTVRSLERGGAVWQSAFLSLGLAYEHLGRTADAERAYERVCRLPAPHRDWTFNKMLVALARLKRGHGDLVSAQRLLAEALDVTVEFPDAYRGLYEADTAAEVSLLMDQARRAQKIRELEQSAEVLVRESPLSPGAWYELGLAREAACDLGGAQSAYERGARLVRPGAGSFLVGRPAPDVARGCEASR